MKLLPGQLIKSTDPFEIFSFQNDDRILLTYLFTIIAVKPPTERNTVAYYIIPLDHDNILVGYF